MQLSLASHYTTKWYRNFALTSIHHGKSKHAFSPLTHQAWHFGCYQNSITAKHNQMQT
jgi:hypothetical protein